MQPRTWAAMILAIAGVGLTVAPDIFSAGCNSDSDDTIQFLGLYGPPLLLAVAGFALVTRRGGRRWWGIAAGIAIAVVSFVLLVTIALVSLYAPGGCEP